MKVRKVFAGGPHIFGMGLLAESRSTQQRGHRQGGTDASSVRLQICSHTDSAQQGGTCLDGLGESPSFVMPLLGGSRRLGGDAS